MDSLPTARDYYYSNLAPEEAGASFHAARTSSAGIQLQAFLANRATLWSARQEQETRSYGLSEEEAITPGALPDQLPPWLDLAAKLKAWTPGRSNDPLLHALLGGLAKGLEHDHPTLAARTANAFVAKRADLSPQAGALAKKEAYSGDLIVFHVGLSDACFQYAIAHIELWLASSYHSTYGGDDPRTVGARVRLQSSFGRLAGMTMRWKADDDRVILGVSDTLVSSPRVEADAANLAVTADAFILAHEVAHHLFDHPEENPRALAVINELPGHCRLWEQASWRHRHELQADALAQCMLTYGSIVQGSGRTSEVLSGPALAFTVLGQLVADVDKPSLTHPALRMRAVQAESIAEYLLQPPLFSRFQRDFQTFQVMLFACLGRGLGKYHLHLLELSNRGHS